jgi:hypothetical protein
MQAVVIVDYERSIRNRIRFNGSGMARDSEDSSTRGGVRKIKRSEVNCWGGNIMGSVEFV